MSHQSGIQVSRELASTFADAVKSGEVRLIRISIRDESLVVSRTERVQNNWEQDFSYVYDSLEEKTPCYILYRMDTKSASAVDYEWIFLCYVPDSAKVRDKMLYASTRATLTKELGDSRFVDAMYGTDARDFTLEGYRQHLAHKNAEAPLTERERELAEVKNAETVASEQLLTSSSRRNHAAGVTFPLSADALDALRALSIKEERNHNLVQLSIDAKSETIQLDSTAQIDLSADENALANAISAESPRYSIFAFAHQGEEAFVFAYTCPSKSKIRERMLYSSCKACVLQALEAEAGLRVSLKLETNDPAELTGQHLRDELPASPSAASSESSSSLPTAPPQPSARFSRPTAPGRRPPTRKTMC
ncbi:uncharacterized protein VTP21DRAFT_4681 [Calcarisporiella thermophila]|uniref:uncharacterized protein n=1 Tax=Calcarisporiella thermophila TaxID=911321 RepID=UPI00374344D8